MNTVTKNPSVKIVSITDHDTTDKSTGGARSEKSLNKIGFAISQRFVSQASANSPFGGVQIADSVISNKAESGVELSSGRARNAYFTIDKFVYSEDENGVRTITDKPTKAYEEFLAWSKKLEASGESPKGVKMTSVLPTTFNAEDKIVEIEATKAQILAHLELGDMSDEDLMEACKENSGTIGFRPILLNGEKGNYVYSNGEPVWRKTVLAKSTQEDLKLPKDEVVASEINANSAFVGATQPVE